MARVAATDDNNFLAASVHLSACELGRMAEAVALELGDAWDVRGKVLLARVASSLNDVLGVEGSGFLNTRLLLALNNDCPLLL